MALHCGIIGIAGVGKTTIFNCLSSTKATAKAGFSPNKSNLSTISVPDARLYELEKFQKTEKIVHATIEMVDIPGLMRSQGKGEGNKFLADIRNADALVHVLRCYEDDSNPHIEGSVNPVRDMETVDLELQIKDLESVEKKIHRIEKAAKIGDKDAKKVLDILMVYKHHLENFQSARTVSVGVEDRKHVEDLALLSAKPVIYVCNVDAPSVSKGNKWVDKVKDALKDQETEVLVIAGAAEAEISELDNPDDRLAFLMDIGLEEPGVNKLVRSAYRLLNLLTFFTVGPKEIRAWTIKNGMNAQQSSGVIHSDLERGFIRAEVMKYNDFISLGSEQACKDKGRFFVEGKNYIIGDGDILHVRFNV
ncbi:MAG: redox-regulated ATPase YchF [Bacteroidia bacterium]|nr:redox-regulated ATPase YchF [Bacteroidia bacterium]